MAQRIPWDKQETALLIDAYLRVKNKELTQQEAVKEISTLLRRRAVLSGIEIDEIFRNENGIRMQMMGIQGLMENNSTGLKNASKLFSEMVELYKSHPDDFSKLLIQAKGECVMQVSIQDKFFAWLSARVSSAQLSEFYIVCRNIEAFCMNKRILVAPLFETTDFETLKYVVNTIRTNRMFQFKYFRQLGKMKKVMEYYLAFLRENPVQKVTAVNTVKKDVVPPENIVAEEPIENTISKVVEQEEVVDETDSDGHTEDVDTAQVVATAEEVTAVEDANIVSETENVISIDNTKDDNNNSIWNFADERIDFSIITPTVISYFGEGRECNGWQSAFTHIIGFLQEDYPAIIRGMVGYRFAGVGKVILSGRAGLRRFNKAEELNNDLYLETDCTPDEIVTIVHLLMDKCNMDYDNIEITYKCRQCENENSIDIENISSEVIVEKSQDDNTTAVTEYIEDNEGPYDEKVDGGHATKNELIRWTKDIIDTAGVSINDITQEPFKDKVGESEAKVVPEPEDEIKKTRIAFIAWAQSQQMQKVAILAYLSDIKKCSEFAKENDYITEEHILLIEDANALERVFLEMRKDSRFVALNNERQKRPVSAMNKLIAFRRATGNNTIASSVSTFQSKPVEKPVQCPRLSVAASSVDPQVKERYTAILAENFVDGFRPAKAIDRNRFRMYYSDMFGQELTEEDEQLVRTLMKVGTFRDERIFVKDETEQKDLLEEIDETIMETFKEGASCIYLDCLFTKFQEQLAEMLHVYNVDSLESVLLSSKKRNYFKRYNYLFGYNKEPAPARDVVEYMKNAHLPVTYSKIKNDLWYIPLDKIKHTLVTTPGIVNVASEAYLYAPNLPVSEQELQQIAELISQALLQRSYISDVELMQLIGDHCPSVLMNTPDYPMWGRRNALAYLLHEKFSFRGAIISDKDEEISMDEVFSDFCQRSEHLTVDELRNFASELNTVIYWDSVYGEMVRINQNEFVRRDQIHFDIEQTDSVLDSLIQSAYTPIKTINLFLHFPTIDVPWNNFVLESYVANYSKKFRLLHASYTATDCCGAIVRQESGISDYRTLIVDVLSKNTSWKNKKDALQLLVDLGYQQRRAYSDIEKVMQEAKTRMNVPKK